MSELIHEVMDKKGSLILVGIFLLLFIFESVAELRARRQKRMKRAFMNAIFSIPGFLGLRLILLPAMVWIAFQNQEWKIGLNFLYELPAWTEGAIAFLLLDYMNYLWHVLNHKVPLLWRFHLVHHTDIDMDVTTAIRFHAGETITSVVFRGLAVLLTGATPILVLVYEIIFEAATQFHHSNWRLPVRLEKVLNKVIVTPRMHGIHHSVIRNETDSNYSVIFSWWDRLHKTFNIILHKQDAVTGVPSYSNPRELTVGYLLKLPFTKIRRWDHSMPKEEDIRK